MPGESANVTVKIVNNSTVAMDKIRIRLRRTVTLRARNNSHNQASDVSNTDQVVNILPGGEQSVAVVLPIPAEIQVTFLLILTWDIRIKVYAGLTYKLCSSCLLAISQMLDMTKYQNIDRLIHKVILK